MEKTTNTQDGTVRVSPAQSETSAGATIREKVEDARDHIADKARAATTRIQSESKDMLRDQKNRVADRIDHYGNAVHRAANNLEDGQDAAIAFYTHRAAEQLERAARYLREREWRDLRRDAESFARRHQEVFLCGLLLGGIALARFLKASSHQDSWEASTNEPGTTYERSTQGMMDSAEDTGSI
jgi:hypothetical protein